MRLSSQNKLLWYIAGDISSIALSPFIIPIADHEAKRQVTSVSSVFTVAQIDEPDIHTLLSYSHSLFYPSAKVLKTFLQNFIELSKDNVTHLNNLTQTYTTCQWTNPNSNICPAPFPTH